MKPTETVGDIFGRVLAPVTAAVARARRARMFHPVGIVLRAEVVPLVRDTHDGADLALDQVAARISGPALVRLSSAWWKRREWIDALGCAVRFRSTKKLSPEPAPGDQDLLFATIRFPATTLLAPLTTHQHDFLANHYYAVSPLDVEGAGRAKLRLAPTRHPTQARGRPAKLEQALDEGHAAFRFELKARRPSSGWQAIAELRLVERVDVDQRALHFWPFRDGRGFHPRGFVHALRRGAYKGSYAGRDSLH
jgi:hypothetical protein